MTFHLQEKIVQLASVLENKNNLSWLKIDAQSKW